jgi:hypothetical protein
MEGRLDPADPRLRDDADHLTQAPGGQPLGPGMLRNGRPAPGSSGGKTDGMADAMSTSASTPGLDPDEPIPDTPAELEEPELPAPPIESTPEDPGGDPGEEPAPV